MNEHEQNYEIHVISHTHWDREWRYSFAETRLQLVDMFERLFEVLDNNPEWKFYHLDAHTILLEDYLEVCPEMEGKLKDYIRQGRLLVGPWYTLPEEFLVSGESLVRNLLIGHQTASKFGEVMKVGYTPTSCGQISQLPQIYDGFGVKSILFYRGMNPEDAKAEFLWRGADGTTLLTFHFYTWGRSNFFSMVLNRIFFGKDGEPKLNDQRNLLHMKEGNYPYLCDAMGSLSDCKEMALSDLLAETKADAVSKATTPYLLYMDGCDNGVPHHPYTISVIDAANKMPGKDKYIHSSLPDYVEKVRKTAKNLEVLTGEMRHQGKSLSNAVYAGILSARMYLKQRNVRSEHNLAGHAEPWSTVAWLLNGYNAKGQLELAWKYLLANHAHDSIEGISLDSVHNDMEYRFDQCDEMSLGILRRSFLKIVSQLPLTEGNEQSLVVFNSLLNKRSEVISVDVNFPVEEGIKDFSLFCGDKEVPLRIVSHQQREILSEWAEFTRSHSVDSYKINFLAEDIPAMGYKIFRIVSAIPGSDELPDIAKPPYRMENKYISVKINTDGSLEIVNKQNGQVYDRLHVFEDQGEAGNGLWHRSMNDKSITSLNGKADVSLEYADCFVASYRIVIELSLPVGATSDKTSRSTARETFIISSVVTLRYDSKRVDIVTTFDNQVKDHRLRVLFPSGIKTDKSSAAGQFDVLSREIKSPYRKGWAEERVTTLPNYGFVDVSDQKEGLAVINEGLTEYQVIDDEDRTIALTLVRAFEKACGVDARENTGVQCLRKFQYRYAIYPHTGDWCQGNVYQEARHFAIEPKLIQCTRQDSSLDNGVSFFQLESKSLILSALKRSENGSSIILRFFNPTSAKVRTTLSCFRNIEKGWETNLNEERLRELNVEDQHRLTLNVGPKKIVTLEIILRKQD